MGDNPHVKCACDNPFVTPLGKVYPCGCRKTCLGQVREGVQLRSEHFEGYCERQTAAYKENVLDVIAQFA